MLSNLFNKFKKRKYGASFIVSGDISSAKLTTNGQTMSLASWMAQNISNYYSNMFSSGLPVPKIWYGTVLTNSSGIWVASFPPGLFTNLVFVVTQALSVDATAANSASASLTSKSTTSVSGVVYLPNTITVGGSPVKTAGANISVDVVVLGY